MVHIEILSEKKYSTFSLGPKDFVVLGHCPICKSPTNQDALCEIESTLKFSWCTACHHMYVDRRPSPQWLESFYNSTWDKTQRVKNRTFPGLPSLRVLKRKITSAVDVLTNRKFTICDEVSTSIPNFCSPVLSRGDKILDVGCGYGWTLTKFKDLGFKSHGIESSAHRTQFVKNKGVPCQNIGVENLTEDTFGTKFDLITSNHVLEHVSEPNEFMEAIKRVVAEDKYICITVPNFYVDFLLSSFLTPVHLHCFTPRSLSILLRNHGFRIRKMTVDHQIRILAQRANEENIEVFPFESESLTQQDLKKYVLKNLLPGKGIHKKENQKNSHFLISWGPFIEEKINFSRALDQAFNIQVNEIPTEAVAEIMSQEPDEKFRRKTLCKVTFEKETLPILISYKNGPQYNFWSAEW